MLFPHRKKRYRRLCLPKNLKQQRGIVIIVALFIVALVATMAYVMMARLERDTRRTHLLVRNVEAEMLAQGSIAWAIDTLKNNYEQPKPNQCVDPLPLHTEIKTTNGYVVTSTLDDMQARFNVNNLTTLEAQADFKRLAQSVLPDVKETEWQGLMESIHDWISKDQGKRSLAQYYLEQKEPYRASHRLMSHLSELLLVKGITPQQFQALEPYLVALPQPTPINVQTASEKVLMSLSPTLTLSTANAITIVRRKTPFISVEKFLGMDLIKNHTITAQKITTVSTYFLLVTEVSMANQQLTLYTLLERTINHEKAKVQIVWQSKGTW